MAPKERKDGDGIAVAVTLLIAGALCIFAPRFFDAVGWRETAWHVGGLVSAVIGSAGLVQELGKLRGGEKLGNLGGGAVSLLLALGLALAVTAWKVRSPGDGLLRATVAVFLFFGIYGVVAAGVEMVKERRSSDRRSLRGDLLLALAVGAIGLTTAAVNLYAAFQAVPAEP